MKHTISVLVDNKPGVLARIAGLFSARGYNITSLAVSETLDPSISSMTLVVFAEDERILEQIKKQLNKLIDVITVTDYTKKGHVARELILAKVCCAGVQKAKLKDAAEKLHVRVIEHSGDVFILEIVGDQAYTDRALSGLSEFGLSELVRTGTLVIA
jgi:acetolactate synthase I/III small subunit